MAILISLVAGSLIGLWIGMSKKADELISPVVYILYPIPKIAFLPILMILFGLGNAPKIVLIITIVIFQIIVAVRDGVKEIPKELFYSVVSLGLEAANIPAFNCSLRPAKNHYSDTNQCGCQYFCFVLW